MDRYQGMTAEMYRAVVAVVDERTEAMRVTRRDFDRLTRTVGELAQAQVRAAERVGRLEEGQAALQQGQAAMQAAIQRLAEAQTRTEEGLGRLEEAQARTEERMSRLEEGQVALQQGQVALQQGQAAMQAAIQRLAEAQARTDVAVGSLAENIGFGLEDIARLLLPPYLHKHYGIQLAGPAGEELERRFFPLPDRPPAEINLYGEGQRDGRKTVVLGEAKARIGGGVVKDFADVLEQVQPLVEGEVWSVMFGYYIHPSAQPVAQDHRILLVASYQR